MIDMIKNAQIALQSLGLYDGSVDGIIGSKTVYGLIQAYNNTNNPYIHKLLQLSENIHLTEVIKSNTGNRLGIDNTPNGTIYHNLKESAVNLWQPARDILGVPILISSGYRCPRLNQAVKGAKNSSHMYGYAIDFIAPKFGNTRQVVKALQDGFKSRGIRYDQLILEYPNSANSWVHLGYKRSDGNQRKHTFQIG